jgi:hypothetical protein
MTSKELKQVNQTKGIMKYMLSRLIFKRSTFGRYPCGKIEVLYGALLWHSPHATAIKKFTEWAGEGSAFAEWMAQMI